MTKAEQLVEGWDKDVLAASVIADLDDRVADSTERYQQFVEKWGPRVRKQNGFRIDIQDAPKEWIDLIDEFLDAASEEFGDILQLKMKYGGIDCHLSECKLDKKTFVTFREKLHDPRLIF